MSLINDMLRDLDARRAQPAGGRMTALPAAQLDGGSSGRRGVVIFAAGSVVLVAVWLALLLPGEVPALAYPDMQEPPGETGEAAGTVRTRNLRDVNAYTGESRLQGAPATTATVAGTDHTRDTRPHSTPAATNKPQDAPSRIEITAHIPSAERRKTRLLRLAGRAAAAGRDSEAMDRLEQVLAMDDASHQARLLLANIFIRQQRHDSAETLLTQGLARYPLHAPYARLLAHLLVAKDRYAEAIPYLESALPAARQDAGYHALLAGLYQRTGDPQAAARHYTAGLELSPDHGEWWMGLGLSREQAGDSRAARSAYTQALRYPLTTALQEFINQRLHALPQPAPLHGSIDATREES